MAELLTNTPLFPGTSELDQLYRISCVLGAINEQSWPEGANAAQRLGIRLPQTVGSGLSEVLRLGKGNMIRGGVRGNGISDDAVDLISKLLVYNPSQRLTAEQAMKHRWSQQQ
ncbi:MAG: hypothetical protein EZS28_020594 [Streblomastix strix]|uniref:Protein kinase domain-containing protein n=1 Tax=Streblomastix strix TaxID=222440 RepID=A0A5J4VMT2_9EUKA|nr:MAG: hypothetical protein EZS28_020594 [Streblomastix strix]